MRPIHKAHLGKTRPALVLTRELARPAMTRVTVAPITGTVRGLSTEVLVGPENGLDKRSAVSCDSIITIPSSALGALVGYFGDDQERALAEAIAEAFDLDDYV